MSQNAIPKFRARVIDLMVQANKAHTKIQEYQADDFQLEKGIPAKLREAKSAYDALLRELASLNEINRDEISRFYPPADYELLRAYSDDLASWTSKLRSWILRAQNNGVVPKCSERRKSVVASNLERAHGSSQSVANDSEILGILQRLITIQKSIETDRTYATSPRKSLEAIQKIKATKKLVEAANAKATSGPFGPNTTDLQQAFQALGRAVDAYKACRWHFYQVESDHPCVLEQTLSLSQQGEHSSAPTSWVDAVDKAIKQLLVEHRQEIADMIIRPSTELVAASCEEVQSKLFASLQYPLQAIYLVTEHNKSQGSKEQQHEATSDLQNCQDLDGVGDSEVKMLVDDPSLPAI